MYAYKYYCFISYRDFSIAYYFFIIINLNLGQTFEAGKISYS